MRRTGVGRLVIGFNGMTLEDLRDQRLDAYRTVALYARAYAQAIDAEDAVWERGMREELDCALAAARRAEIRIQSGVAA